MVLLFALCACTGSETTSDSTQPPQLPKDPCGVVSESDVARAMGVAVKGSAPVPAKRMRVPGGPRLCEYEMDGRYLTVVVAVEPSNASAFARVRDRDPRNNDPIQALGEEAFSSGLGSVWVRAGAGYFVVGVQRRPGREAVRDLRQLAAAGLDQMGFPRSSP